MPHSNRPDRRRYERRPVHIKVAVRTASGLRQNGYITDISEGGCAFTTQRIGYGAGSIYTLRAQGLEALAGWTEWVSPHSAGLAFDRLLHPSVVDHLAMNHPPPPTEHEP